MVVVEIFQVRCKIIVKHFSRNIVRLHKHPFVIMTKENNQFSLFYFSIVTNSTNFNNLLPTGVRLESKTFILFYFLISELLIPFYFIPVIDPSRCFLHRVSSV